MALLLQEIMRPVLILLLVTEGWAGVGVFFTGFIFRSGNFFQPAIVRPLLHYLQAIPVFIVVVIVIAIIILEQDHTPA